MPILKLIILGLAFLFCCFRYSKYEKIRYKPAKTKVVRAINKWGQLERFASVAFSCAFLIPIITFFVIAKTQRVYDFATGKQVVTPFMQTANWVMIAGIVICLIIAIGCRAEAAKIMKKAGFTKTRAFNRPAVKVLNNQG